MMWEDRLYQIKRLVIDLSDGGSQHGNVYVHISYVKIKSLPYRFSACWWWERCGSQKSWGMPARARKAPTLQSASEPLDMPTLEKHAHIGKAAREFSCDLRERLSSVFTSVLKEVAVNADSPSDEGNDKGTCAQLLKSVALILMNWVPYHVNSLQSVRYNCYFSFELLLRPEIPPCLVVYTNHVLYQKSYLTLYGFFKSVLHY